MSFDFTNTQLDRLLDIFDRYVASQESIAASLPGLIEAMGRRGGGGGYNKKDGKDWGLFALPPDLTSIPDGDIFHIPALSYNFHQGYKRLQFYSPYTKEGEVDPAKGIRIASIDPSKKTFTDVFKDWKYDDTGTKCLIAKDSFRILKMRVSTYDGKKIASIVGVVAPPDDLEKLVYVEQKADDHAKAE